MEPDARPIDIHRKIVELIDGGGPLAVATVLSTEGSTPQRVGAKAAIDAAGHIWGTVGGGAVEAEAQRVAVEACRTQHPVIFDFQLNADDAGDVEPICGGRMRILVDPTPVRHRSCYLAATAALERCKRGVLLTTIRMVAEGDSERQPTLTLALSRRERGLVHNVQIEWLTEGSLAGRAAFPGISEIQSCLEHNRPQRFVEAGSEASMEVFVEPVVPRPLLLIAGGGHVGRALALLAVEIGFDVTVIDDRPEFADPALFPNTVRVCCRPVAEAIADQPMSDDTYIVIVTRGHRHDADALRACIHQRPGYIGMIGSRRKVALLRKSFLENGWATEEELDRVFAPIGLPIGAVTVPEIAVSIAGQLIAVRRKRVSVMP